MSTRFYPYPFRLLGDGPDWPDDLPQNHRKKQWCESFSKINKTRERGTSENSKEIKLASGEKKEERERELELVPF